MIYLINVSYVIYVNYEHYDPGPLHSPQFFWSFLSFFLGGGFGFYMYRKKKPQKT